MSNLTEQLSDLFRRVSGLQSRLTGLSPDPNLFAAMGERVSYGCKVTAGASAADRVISLEGVAAGDTNFLNPNLNLTPVYPFEYPNVAFTRSGGFFSTDLTATVALPPGSGSGRNDIAYIFLGPAGPGFAVATGTPSVGAKTDYTSNGLNRSLYNPNTDVPIPVGAMAVARIYTESAFTGVANAQIADIRAFAFSGNATSPVFKMSATAPQISVSGTMTFELTSNTKLKILAKGTDGVTRSVTLTLAP